MPKTPSAPAMGRRAAAGLVAAAACAPLAAALLRTETRTAAALPGTNGKRLFIRSFGAKGDGSDETAAVQRAVSAAIVNAPCTLDFEGLSIRIGIIDVGGADNVTFDGAGARVMPIGQTGGRFSGERFGDVAFTRFTFEQQAGWNYMPAIKLLLGRSAVLRSLRFEGCGFGAHVQGADIAVFDHIILREIGVYPRPRPLDPGENGFAEAFEIYGGGLRAAFCDRVIFSDNIDFRNRTPAGGHIGDRSGGAGGCTTLACDNVEFGAGIVINAPGQGFAAAGEWQGQDVVGQTLAGRYEPHLRGRNILFLGCRATGCNQEGCTAFGVNGARMEDVKASNNRASDIEIWQSRDAEIIGGSVFEDASSDHPLRNHGALSGSAAVHVVESVDVTVRNLECLRSRHGGVAVQGSMRVNIRNCDIREYGLDDGPSYLSSGVICNAGLYSRNAQDVFIGPGNRFTRTLGSASRGGDIFAQHDGQRLYAWDNIAVGRDISIVNAPRAVRRRAPPAQ